MGAELWDSIKLVINWIIVPVMAAVWWVFKKHIARMDNLEKRVIENEKAVAVMDSQLRDLKQDIAEIKKGIDKLLHKLL